VADNLSPVISAIPATSQLYAQAFRTEIVIRHLFSLIQYLPKYLLTVIHLPGLLAHGGEIAAARYFIAV
jgi:hypothetical protein